MIAAPPTPTLVDSLQPPHAAIVVQESLPPDAMLTRCQALHAADKTAERRKARFKWVAVAAGAVAGLSFMVGMVSEAEALFVAAGIWLVILVVVLVVRSVLGRADIDDRRLHVVQTLVSVLGGEMKRRAPVRLWLDFAGYHKARAQGRGAGFMRSTGQRSFERPWLRMSFTLADGSQVAVHARTSCKRKEKSKRKYTKVKDRIVDDLAVYVRPPRGVSFDPAAQGRAKAELPKQMKLTCTAVRVKPRVTELSFRTRPGLRHRGRAGWTAHDLGNLLDGGKALEAVLASYRAAAATRVR